MQEGDYISVWVLPQFFGIMRQKWPPPRFTCGRIYRDVEQSPEECLHCPNSCVGLVSRGLDYSVDLEQPCFPNFKVYSESVIEVLLIFIYLFGLFAALTANLIANSDSHVPAAIFF